MALRDRLCDSSGVATATPATPATPEPDKSGTVAKVATVAVANPENAKTSGPVLRLNPDPDGACSACGSGQWWQLPGAAWHCRACNPDVPLTATTLTLAANR